MVLSVEGESNIPNSGKRIRHMYSEPAQPKPERCCVTCYR